MIVDSFIFYNELDILEIRLEELYPVVDRFVLVESDLTFRGNPKPYFFEENKQLFSRYLDKIVHIKIEDNNVYSADPTKAPWEREEWQRNQISVGIDDVANDAIIIVADVDEIPRRSVVAELNPTDCVRIGMNMYYYALNVLGGVWGGAKAVRKHSFTSAEEIRKSSPSDSVFGGWHFSYLQDDPKVIVNKLKNFSHRELDIPEITDLDAINERMNRLEDIWGYGEKYTLVEVDDSYPVAVLNDLDYFSRYIR